MKIAIYHPALNIFGGGETVALTIASFLKQKHEVTIFCSVQPSIPDMERFFGLDLQGVKLETVKCSSIFPSTKPARLLRKSYKLMEKCDLVIDTQTNGWFDRKLNTKTISYIHFPWFQPKKTGIRSLLNPLLIDPAKAFQYDTILCNSEFTRSILEKMTDRKIKVLYPPVDVNSVRPAKKKKQIVSVGRFTYDKKHEVMIDAFKKMDLDGYSLHLIGTFRDDPLYSKAYMEMLKERAFDADIQLHINMPHKDVLQFLAESEIYWHARGYSETDPNEYENFGITTVEAMAAGCIPIVINLGAQPEIVEHAKTGYCWDSPEELIKYTLKRNPRIAAAAVRESRKYSKENFLKSLGGMIGV